MKGPFSLEASTRFLEGFPPAGTFAAEAEAAAWAILSQRVRTAQAARIRQRLTERHGSVVELGGLRLAAFPSPEVLRDLSEIEGVPARKLRWLHGVADAALAGALGGARLRALEPAQALTELRELAGVGPFAAELVLIRDALHPDVFPERRRPYRSWVGLVLRAARSLPRL